MDVLQARERLQHKPGRFRTMFTISGTARGIRRAGVMAVAAMAVTAMSHGRAEALSLTSPATLPLAKHAGDGVIEVRGGHGGHGGGHGGFRGGGGGFRGGMHGGGGFRAYHGGGFRAAHVYRGGGYRHFGGYRVNRYAYHRPYFHRRHFHHRRYFAPAYYGYYPRHYRVCRVVWTYYGPRRICRPPHWHRRHYWRVRYG
jgi:hypothetical protein